MASEPPLAQRILDAAETVLRRHGAEKTNAVDVARALGMSHANIYRHFPNKKALLDAVAARWLHKINAPLEVIATDTARLPMERLVAWFDTLRHVKRRKTWTIRSFSKCTITSPKVPAKWLPRTLATC